MGRAWRSPRSCRWHGRCSIPVVMQTILVGLDGSPLAETILPFLELVAKKTGAGLALFHVVSEPDRTPSTGDDAGIEQLFRTARQRAEAYLNEQRWRLAAAGLRVS